MAEGARLEIACRAKPPTVGSNPTLSARTRHHARRGFPPEEAQSSREKEPRGNVSICG